MAFNSVLLFVYTFIILSYSLVVVPPICHIHTPIDEVVRDITISKTWDGGDVHHTPAIFDVNGDTYSDIIFINAVNSTLYVLSGEPHASLAVLWTYTNAYGYGEIAVSIQNGGMICFPSAPTPGLTCLNFSGHHLFTNLNFTYAVTAGDGAGTQVSFIDIDSSGTQLIIAGNYAYDCDGLLVWIGQNINVRHEFDISDLNNDGLPELIYPDKVLNGINGTDYALFNHTQYSTFDTSSVIRENYAQVADFDEDGTFDILKLGTNYVSIWRSNGTILTLYNMTGNKGSPVIRDINKDGFLDIGFECTRTLFCMLTFNKTSSQIEPLWNQTINDTTGISGGLTADLNGDGEYEVLFADTTKFYIFSSNGALLYVNSTIRVSDTVKDYPLYVDLDNDGAGEIIFVNYGVAITAAITVLSANIKSNWAPTTSVWTHWGYSFRDGMYVTRNGNYSKIPWRDSNLYKGAINACCTGNPDPFFSSFNPECVAQQWVVFGQTVVKTNVSKLSLGHDVHLILQSDFVLEQNSKLNIIVSEQKETGSLFVENSSILNGIISIDLKNVDLRSDTQFELKNIITYGNPSISFSKIEKITVETAPAFDPCMVEIEQIPDVHSLSIFMRVTTKNSQRCDSEGSNTGLIVGLTVGLIGGCFCVMLVVGIAIVLVYKLKQKPVTSGRISL